MKKLFILLGTIFGAVGVLFVVLLLRDQINKHQLQSIETSYELPSYSFTSLTFSETFSETTFSTSLTAEASKESTATVTGETQTTSTDVEPRDYQSPVDFEELERINSEIYAWLDVPGTNISYPVLQSADNDLFYMDRAADRSYYFDGSLFTQKTYNGLDFSDPVTVIYGHRMGDGKMFNNLQSFFSGNGYADPGYFSVYLKDCEYHYQVFAALPYDNRHLLYYTDFNNEAEFNEFFDCIVNSRALGANTSPELVPKYGDKVVILETCLRGNSKKRFLVMGKLIQSVITQ